MGYGDHKTFEVVSRVNLERAQVWHDSEDGICDWSAAEWGNALAGECGELCNVLKKILRVDKGYRQSALAHLEGVEARKQLVEAAAQEVGDTFLYLDLVCSRLGLDLYECVRDTFNRVSEREGFDQRLGL